jgi:CRISPR system Cascade subunit CasA
MAKVQFDTLRDPLIRAQMGGALRRISLPALLAALVRDDIQALPALRPHQRHALHMFLAQVGALALHRAKLAVPPMTEDAWRTLLLQLTPEHPDTAWAMVVEDIRLPALLQPPAPEGSIAGFRNTVSTPDALDVLITAKNFDLKSAIATQAEPDDWLFALISLQTMEGYSGATRYGIARMKHGDASRAFLGLAPPGGIGAHVRRDMLAMLAGRDRLLELYTDYPLVDGIGLTWLEPWDGMASLGIDRLDLWFVEVCRRVRLCLRADGSLTARTTGSAVARVDAKHRNGVTGDFWAPVNDAEGKAFSPDVRGFSSRVLTRLLFVLQDQVNFRLPPSMAALPEDQAMQVIARGVCRGQGKTEGFHERIIPFADSALAELSSAEGRKRLGKLAEAQQREIEVISRALRLGCAIVAAGGGEAEKKHYERAKSFLRRLDQECEADFFAALQDRLIHGDQAKAPYLRSLIAAAATLLKEAADTIPCASLHRHRARSDAERAFWGTLWGPKSELLKDKALIQEPEHAS